MNENMIWKRVIPLCGVATLLWNGHIFSAGGTQFATWSAYATTAIWIYLFGKAYDIAWPA